MENTTINNTPPIKFERNEFGLLTHIQYKFLPTGFVDWKGMLLPEHLYIIKPSSPARLEQLEKKYGKKYEELKVTEVDDKELAILLVGIRSLLFLRGHEDIYINIEESNLEYCSANVNITFIANFESLNKNFTFSGAACAHYKTTKGFGQNYLVETATNRAFCRAVRNALNVNIVTKEEISDELEYNSPSEPQNESGKSLQLLESVMSEKGLNFDKIKEKLISEGIKAENWTKLLDIPKDIQFDLISRLKKLKNPKTS